jgi:hypothetical protein
LNRLMEVYWKWLILSRQQHVSNYVRVLGY